MAVAATPVAVSAQVALPVGPNSGSSAPDVQLGGKGAMDLIRLDPGKYSFPLRFGNVRHGSEIVELDGRRLVKDTDYSIDYSTGVIYLMRPFRPGQALRVNYRYDDKASQVGVFAADNQKSTGFSGLKLEFNPQASFILGLGLTERLKDGTVLSSNVYGVSNAFNLSGGNLKGVFMVGQRVRSDAMSLFGDYNGGNKQPDEGTGSAIVQNYSTDAAGGKLSIDYQDVNKKFAGFDAMKQNGVSDADVAALQKERGLKRSGFDLKDAQVGALKFGSGFRSVGDAGGSINWRNYAFGYGGLTFSLDEQDVDSTFTRFKDIREGDRALLQKERGLNRQITKAGFASGGASIAFNSFELNDGSKAGIEKHDIDFKAHGLALNYSDQTIDQAFTQFVGLRPKYDDQNTFNIGQIQRESGVGRRSLDLSTDSLGGSLKYASSAVSFGGSRFASQSLSAKYGKFDLDYLNKSVDQGFSRMTSLQPQELKENADAISKMVNPKAAPNGQDMQLFSQSAGVGRELWRVGYDFGGGYTVRFDDASLNGSRDRLLSQAYTVTGPKYSLNYRSTNVGDQFTEIGQLMRSEQGVFGTMAGMAKSDFDVGVKLDKSSKLDFSQMAASVGSQGLSRRVIGYTSKTIGFEYSRRIVDPGFLFSNSLVDPERQILSGLVGFDQTSLKAKVQVFPNLGINLNWADANNMLTDENRHWRESSVDWNMVKGTKVSAYQAEQLYKDNTAAQVDREFDRLLLQQSLGSFGTLSLMQEQRHFNGEQDETPSSVTQQVAYSTNLTKTTKIETSQSETRFETGERETAMTNTINTNVTDRIGVGVTDTKVNRAGDKPDSQKRDYGFWMDFGRNIRFTYGQVRDLSNPSAGTRNEKVGLTSGQFAGLDVKSLQYTRDVWDNRRSKSMGNVNIKTVKPLDLGTIDNVEFFYTADTLHDMDKWAKENRTMGFTGNLGPMSLGYGYRSQVSPNGDRAIDRVFSFNTDKSGKSAVRAELNYDLRTMPTDEVVAIRDLKFVAKFSKDWQVENSIMTNPLKQNNQALLGGVAQDTRTNNWKVNYLGGKSLKAGFVFEEMRNDKTNLLSRKTGIDLTLFASNPSPLTLGYRSVQTDGTGPRSTSHEFWVRFDQRPGPNQTFSMMFGNMNYEGFRPSSSALQNWSLRLDYGIRF